LIVDDNVTNRHILEEWLNDWQMKPSAVAGAAGALDALVHAASTGQPYELVLLDAQMPEMDGLTLAAKIRELPVVSTTRIILLTSGDRPSDLVRLRDLQIDANLDR